MRAVIASSHFKGNEEDRTRLRQEVELLDKKQDNAMKEIEIRNLAEKIARYLDVDLIRLDG